MIYVAENSNSQEMFMYNTYVIGIWIHQILKAYSHSNRQ